MHFHTATQQRLHCYNGTPQIHPQNCPSPFDDHYSHLLHPSIYRPHSASQMASGFNQPFCHNTLCSQTDRQTVRANVPYHERSARYADREQRALQSADVLPIPGHGPRKWWPGGANPLPSSTSVGAIHVIGPSWKMLNQPAVSPLTLAVTENHKNCCHQMSDFKSFVGLGSALDPAYILYSVYFVYVYILFNWPLPPPSYYKIVPQPCPRCMFQSAVHPITTAEEYDVTDR